MSSASLAREFGLSGFAVTSGEPALTIVAGGAEALAAFARLAEALGDPWADHAGDPVRLAQRFAGGFVLAFARPAGDLTSRILAPGLAVGPGTIDRRDFAAEGAGGTLWSWSEHLGGDRKALPDLPAAWAAAATSGRWPAASAPRPAPVSPRVPKPTQRSASLRMPTAFAAAPTSAGSGEIVTTASGGRLRVTRNRDGRIAGISNVPGAARATAAENEAWVARIGNR